MDESGNGNPDQPLIVGIAAFDAGLEDVEQSVRALFDKLSAKGYLRGFASFDEFADKGFHATQDTLEVSIPFYELIREAVGLKMYMAMTDRSAAPSEAETLTISKLYTALLADIVISSRNTRPLTPSSRRTIPSRPSRARWRRT